MFKLPLLSYDGLRQLMVCGSIDAMQGNQALVQWVQSKDTIAIASDSSTAFIRRIIDLGDSGRIHFHLEAAIDDIFAREPKPSSDLNEVLEVHESMRNVTINARVRGSRLIPFRDLPRQGVVATLLGLTTAAGMSELTLTGCTLEIAGDGPFTEIEARAYDDETAIIRCEAVGEFHLSEELLVEVGNLLTQGFSSLVFEEKETVGCTND